MKCSTISGLSNHGSGKPGDIFENHERFQSMMKAILITFVCLLGLVLHAEIKVDKPGYVIRISEDGTRLLGIIAKSSGKVIAADVDLWEMVLNNDRKFGPVDFFSASSGGTFSHRQTDDCLVLEFRSAECSFDIVFSLRDQEFDCEVVNLKNTRNAIQFMAVPARWTFPTAEMKRFVFPSQANWSMGICFLPSFFEKRAEDDVIHRIAAAPFPGMARLFNSRTIPADDPNSRLKSHMVATEQGKSLYSPEEQRDLTKKGFLRISYKQSRPEAFELGLIRTQNENRPLLIGTQFGGSGYLFQFQFTNQNMMERTPLVESIIFNTMSALRRRNGGLIDGKAFVLIDYPNMPAMVTGFDPVSLDMTDWRKLVRKYSEKFGIEVRTVRNLAELRAALRDHAVGTILNPYGNIFPSDDAANFGDDLELVRSYVKNGGVWWEVGSRSFEKLLRKDYYSAYDRQGRYPSAAADYACAEYGNDHAVALFGVQPTMRFPYDKERAAIPKAYALRGGEKGAVFVHQWVMWVDAKSKRPWNSSPYRVSFRHPDARQGLLAYEKTLELNKKIEDKMPPAVLEKMKNSMLICFWHDNAQSNIRSCKILPKNNIAHFIGALASRFDANYPEHLPPSSSWGTMDDLRELVKVGHENGHLLMPYTNTTWWLPHENGQLSPSQQKWDDRKQEVMALKQDGSPMWRKGRTGRGWALNFYHPYVQQASLKVTRQFAEAGCDMIFMDEMGGHPWTMTWNPDEPWPATALDGRISMCWDSSKVLPTATEEGHDRLLNFNTLFCGGTWKTFPNKQFESQRYKHQFRPSDWQYYPAFLFLGHDRAFFTVHDLLQRYEGFEDLSLALALGYKMKDAISFNSSSERLQWCHFLDAVQKTVAREYEGQKLITFRYPLENTRLPYRNSLVFAEYGNGIRMVCNHSDQEVPLDQLDLPFAEEEMAYLKKQTLPPYGFYVSTSRGRCGYLRQDGNRFAFAMAPEAGAYRAAIFNPSDCRTFLLPDNALWPTGEFDFSAGKWRVERRDGQLALTLPAGGTPDKPAWLFTHYDPAAKPAAAVFPLIRNGAVVSGQKGVRIIANTTQARPNEPLAFHGDAAPGIRLTVPQQGNSMSFIADVTATGLPEKGLMTLVSRTGCNNTLGIDANGRVVMTMWYADRKTQNHVLSKTRLKAGEKAHIAATIEEEKGQTTLRLYINGRQEAVRTTPQRPFPYSSRLLIGSKFRGEIGNLFWADGCLSEAELRKMQEPLP